MAADVVRISYKELEEIALKNEEKKRLKEEKLKELGMIDNVIYFLIET